MTRKAVYILVAVFMVLVSMEVAYVLAQEGGNNNGNNNNGDLNGNNNNGSNNGNNNNGSSNGNNNNGSSNGNNNNGSSNGNNNSGSNNGNNNNGSNNGNNNNGNNNGNNNNGDNNGNGNNGNDNGNNNNGNNNGNNNNGNGNGNNNNGNNNGNNNNGNNNGSNNNGNDSGNNNNGNNNNGNNNNGNNNNSNYNNGNNNHSNYNNGTGNNGQNNGTGNNGKNNGTGNNGKNNGNGNNGNNNGNDNKGNSNGNGNGKKPYEDSAVTDYDMLTPSENGPDKAFCKAKGACHFKTLQCPAECPTRKPKKNKKDKGCFINCSSKCEATCKWRRPKCDGYGSLCYDPRFVGGDGVMFYFHGAKGGNFAVVSDDKLHINAHFIGTRPQGRTRDYTWVQALSVMFDTHTLVIAAKKVSHWDDKIDALIVKWDGETIEIPTDGEAEWRPRIAEREVVVERTDDANNVRVTVAGLVEMDIKVRPIGKNENKVHNYQLPEDDAFAHLETQFRFSNLSELVEGILGKTYRPGYVSPVKVGVPMPIMGGEDKYETPSLYSPVCKFCKFQRPAEVASA